LDIFTRTPATVMSGNDELGGWWFRLHSGTLVTSRLNDLQKSSKIMPLLSRSLLFQSGFLAFASKHRID
jgi:hypothetical protein